MWHPHSRLSAWDVDAFHLEKPQHLKFSSVSIKENGPLRGSVFATVKYGKSTLEVEISLDAVPASLKADARSLIRFDAKADWHEKHMFLKCKCEGRQSTLIDKSSFPSTSTRTSRPTTRSSVRLRAPPTATRVGMLPSELEVMDRTNKARFEVCGHKFADLSEYGYGVALINDCKYG